METKESKKEKGYIEYTLEGTIGRQCAPVLTGVKPANILVVKHTGQEDVCSCFEKTGISCRLLHIEEERTVWMVYRKEKVENIIAKPEYRTFLESLGYKGKDVDGMLVQMAEKFQAHHKKKESFPHEMGIFLGYPLSDVKGFIENKGKNFLYQGQWKVYENVEERKEMFSLYTWVKQQIIQELDKGKALWQAAMSIQIPQTTYT